MEDLAEELQQPAAKRHKRTSRVPRTFVTWNCNGFTTRATWDADKMKRLLEETNYPDFLFLQEARLKAYNFHTRNRPFLSEKGGSAVNEVLQSIFQDYQPVWSLADSMYAGTLTFVHKRLGLNVQSTLGGQVAFSYSWATDLLLQRFRVTRKQVGLETKTKPSSSMERSASTTSSTSATSAASPSKPKPKQTSLLSFFAARKNETLAKDSNDNIHSTRSTFVEDRTHHPEGLFQFFCLDNMDILQTYVPNNGTREERYAKRCQWDQDMLRFLQDRSKILSFCQKEDRPLLWCGDMNVAKDYLDGTHWEKRSSENGEESIYEWWTDESKCFVVKKNNSVEHPDNIGMPSFTPAERRRFREIIREVDFADIWRELHPNGLTNSSLPKWERPEYTWRGHLAKSGNYNARYQGKGQRLDYFLMSPSNLVKYVDQCQILGYGENRDGLFCGSDHCASYLRLSGDFEHL